MMAIGMSPMEKVSPAAYWVAANCASSIFTAAGVLSLPSSIAFGSRFPGGVRIHPPEYRRDGGAEHRELPVHPFARQRAGAQIGRLERAGAELGGEVADDRIGFPQHESVLVQGGNEAVGIHREISRLPVLAERAADVDALVGKAEFADCGHRLLDIGRCVSSPYLEHANPPGAAFAPGNAGLSRNRSVARISAAKSGDTRPAFRCASYGLRAIVDRHHDHAPHSVDAP